MPVELTIMLVCMGIGTVVGLLAGLLGIGGGLIIVPALTYMLSFFLGVSPFLTITIAIATSLSTIILTGLSSSAAHYRLGNVERNIVLFCGLGIALGATLGAQTASVLDGRLLKAIFAALVILVALHMMIGKRNSSEIDYNRPILLLIGVIVGFLSALMGIGGGALLVPALIFFRVELRQAIGCAAVSGLVIALFGTANFIYTGWSVPDLPAYSLGYVYLPAALGIVATSVFTAPIGAKWGQSIATAKLKRFFAVFLVLVSIRMLYDIGF